LGRIQHLRSVVVMNENHARVCTSPEWAQYLQTEILPVLTRDAGLGEEMLEIGPGPGAATDWLRHKVKRLTAVEIDEAAAGELVSRYADTNVEIVVGSGAELSYPEASFDSVGSFTMLHHVPTTALQNKILAEAFRVLRPGGVLIASDSLASSGLHGFHEGDTYNPVEPASVISRLQTIGFDKMTVTVDHALLFAARKPSGESSECGADSADD
jgi:SAM-dependent methyltransferase